MTAYINKLKDKDGNQQLPITHERAVRDSSGTTLESKLQNLEGAMDKAYVAQSDNGMGRITLKKNMVSGVNTLTQSMMQATNTIYVIQYDFTLGENITVPSGCVLEFEGGSISGNGSNKNVITGNNTILVGTENCIKLNITFAGTWKADIAYSDWFSVVDDCILNSDKTVSSATDSYKGFENLFLFDVIKIKRGNYYCSKSLISSSTYKNIDGGGATIKILPSSIGTPLIVINHPSSNVVANDICIHDLTIVGDKTEETAPAQQRGADGLYIGLVDGITIENVCCSYCSNDALYLGNYIDYPKNVIIRNCHFDNAYRNNISITSGINIIIENCIISEVIGSGDPEAGIDLEPNENLYIRNVTIQNCIFKNNNTYDIMLYNAFSDVVNIENIVVSNCIGNGVVSINDCENLLIKNSVFHKFTSEGFSAVSVNRKVNIEDCKFDIFRSDYSQLKDSYVNNEARLYNTKVFNSYIKGGDITRLVNCFVKDTIIEKSGNTQFLIQDTEAHNIKFIYTSTSEPAYGVIGLNSVKLYGFYFDNQSGNNNMNLFYFNDNTSILDYDTNDVNNWNADNNRNMLVIFRHSCSGITSMRPNINLINLGFSYYDVTISKQIWYNGNQTTGWVDATGTPV